MKYVSTRDESKTEKTFEQVVMAGLAPDKGLYVPVKVPDVGSKIEAWRSLKFNDLAHQVMSQFIDEDQIAAAELKEIMDKSYDNSDKGQWRDGAQVTPLIRVGDSDVHVLEQWHGPTCAFKDVALQFVGNLFEFFLERKNKDSKEKHFITVLGATSGDTGSAAIAGLRGKKDVTVTILHPKGLVAKVQELQMTTVLDENVRNIAVEGNFDDCQRIVKTLFLDQDLQKKAHLGAVNSINWARILAQIVYYFSGYFQWLDADKTRKYGDKVSFIVPTGNFGNILAGYYAREMGLPIRKLVVATNSNDILHRFIANGDYSKGKCYATVAPAMDITIPSNFERYLFVLAGRDPARLHKWMQVLDAGQKLDISDGQGEEEGKKRMAELRGIFGSARASDEEIMAAQKDHLQKHKFKHCPHTAVGIHAAEKCVDKKEGPYICMATAHHGKFASNTEAFKDVELVRGLKDDTPDELKNLEAKTSQLILCENDKAAVKKILLDNVVGEKGIKKGIEFVANMSCASGGSKCPVPFPWHLGVGVAAFVAGFFAGKKLSS